MRPSSPKKFEALFPGRLCFFIKLLSFELEMLEEMTRKCDGRPFSDTDDTNVRTPQHRHLQMRQPPLQGQRGDEPGAAATQYDDSLNRGLGHGDHCTAGTNSRQVVYRLEATIS